MCCQFSLLTFSCFLISDSANYQVLGWLRAIEQLLSYSDLFVIGTAKLRESWIVSSQSSRNPTPYTPLNLNCDVYRQLGGDKQSSTSDITSMRNYKSHLLLRRSEDLQENKVSDRGECSSYGGRYQHRIHRTVLEGTAVNRLPLKLLINTENSCQCFVEPIENSTLQSSLQHTLITTSDA